MYIMLVVCACVCACVRVSRIASFVSLSVYSLCACVCLYIYTSLSQFVSLFSPPPP